jgi:hypothetical protein
MILHFDSGNSKIPRPITAILNRCRIGCKIPLSPITESAGEKEAFLALIANPSIIFSGIFFHNKD